MTRARLHLAFVLTGTVALSSPLRADNRFYFSAETVLSESSGNQVEVLCDSDVDALAFSFGIEYEESKIHVSGVANAGTAAADADYYEGMIDEVNGRLGYGCVFDLDGDFSTQRLAAGAGHLLGILTFDAVATTATSAVLAYEDVVISSPDSPVRNVLTNTDGVSVLPALEDGSVTIVTEAPEIVSISPSQGLAGDVFQITGNFFEHDGLAVTVCNAAASATLRPDGVTIDVTAPACPTIGCVAVTVTTVRGSDTEPMGFCYETPPIPPPVIEAIDPAQGSAGTIVTITGAEFDHPSLVVRICGMEATIEDVAPDGTSVDVTAPDCPAGAQDVQACTDGGCDTEPGGFTFVAPDGFVRGDGNSSGVIDLADGITVLAYLFQGAAPPACFDAGDADDNGMLELTDAVRIFSWLFTGGAVPPEPSPSVAAYPGEDCGPDPTTGDMLGCENPSMTCGG